MPAVRRRQTAVSSLDESNSAQPALIADPCTVVEGAEEPTRSILPQTTYEPSSDGGIVVVVVGEHAVAELLP
jgi:hypothetical protein